MNYYIYKTTCLTNGKYYIGAHHGELKDDYLGSGTNVMKAIKKYGREAFVKEVLCVCTNEAAMYFMEAIYVNEEIVKDKKSYNLTLGGKGGWSHLTDEQRQASVKNRTGCKLTRSAEYCKKISERRKGQTMSEEQKDKIRQARTGTKMSTESSLKKSMALKGKPWSPLRRLAN